jgi:hypothetical protein
VRLLPHLLRLEEAAKTPVKQEQGWPDAKLLEEKQRPKNAQVPCAAINNYLAHIALQFGAFSHIFAPFEMFINKCCLIMRTDFSSPKGGGH